MPDRNTRQGVVTRTSGKVLIYVDNDTGRTWFVKLGTVTFFEHPDVDHVVEVTFGEAPLLDAQTEPISLVVESVTFRRRLEHHARPIGSRSIRDAPVAEMTAEALRMLSGVGDVPEPGWRPDASEDAFLEPDMVRAITEKAPRARQESRYSSEELRMVAREYTAAESRHRIESIRRAYRRSNDFETPGVEAVKARIRACRSRIDPDTGASYL